MPKIEDKKKRQMVWILVNDINQFVSFYISLILILSYFNVVQENMSTSSQRNEAKAQFSLLVRSFENDGPTIGRLFARESIPTFSGDAPPV